MTKFFCEIAFLVCFVGTLFSKEQEIVVQVEADSELVPIFLSPVRNENARFSNEYIERLEQVFRFDFCHNGITKVVSNDLSPVAYRVELSIREDTLNARITSSSDDETKTLRASSFKSENGIDSDAHSQALSSGSLDEVGFCLKDVRLTGELNNDRRVLHTIADRIHFRLFGKKGIASTKILFTVKTKMNGKDYSEVWEADYDGGNRRQVTNRVGYCLTPSYIPPKVGHVPASFVFVSYLSGQAKTYVGWLSDGSCRKLLLLSGNQLMPTVSRQRNSIAFISDAAGNPDIFIQDFDPEVGLLGKPRHLFSVPHATQGSPVFSPDGKRIAFVSDKSGTPRIYVLTISPPGTLLKDTQVVLISKFCQENTAPSWSPDGTKLAYCSKIHDVRQIMVYNFLTGIERQLTDGPHHKENPTWGPNSLHLLYNTSDANNCELYLISLNDTMATKINCGPGDKRFPSWEPRSEF